MRGLSMSVGLAAGLLLASFAGANAQSVVPAGTLQCQGGPTIGLAVGSESVLDCTFQRPGRRPEPYAAKISRVGVDVGVTQRWALGWNVLTPTGRVPRGGLGGRYGGVGSSMTIGFGAGSNAVTGGPGGSVVLQPVPTQGQTGLNFALGFQGMELQPVAPAPRRHRHRH